MTTSVTFATIDDQIFTPGQFAEFNPDLNSKPSRSFRILAIGHVDELSTTHPTVPTQMITPEDGFTIFGNDGLIGHMLESIFDNATNPEIWALGVKETTGAAATFTITWAAGAATSAGVYHFVAGNRDYRVAVADGDDETARALATVAAIDDDPRSLFTAVAAVGVTTLTMKTKGSHGDGANVRFDLGRSTVSGGVTDPVVAAGVAGTDVDVTATTILAAMGEKQFHNIVWVLNDSAELLVMETELLDRWGGMTQKEGVIWTGFEGDSATLLTATASRNSAFSTMIPNDKSDTPFFIAASIAAGINANSAAKDPALPKTGLNAIGFRTPFEASSVYDDRATRDTLLKNGVSTWEVESDGTVVVERFVTTARERNGIEDLLFLDVTTVETLGLLRFELNATIALKYPRHKLGNDEANYDPGQAIVTPNTIKGEFLTLAQDWERRALIENGTSQAFRDSLVVDRETGHPNNLVAIMVPDLINQFRVLKTRIDFIL